jgi:hypothetical protein
VHNADFCGITSQVSQYFFFGRFGNHRDESGPLLRQPIPEIKQDRFPDTAQSFKHHAVVNRKNRFLSVQKFCYEVDVARNVIYIPLPPGSLKTDIQTAEKSFARKCGSRNGVADGRRQSRSYDREQLFYAMTTGKRLTVVVGNLHLLLKGLQRLSIWGNSRQK